jgi:hypothetical protein
MFRLKTGTRISNVAYDARNKQFFGNVAIAQAGRVRSIAVSVAGHPGWSYQQLINAFQVAASRVAPVSA